MYGKSKLYFSNISLVGVESAPTFIIWGRKAPPHIINKGFKGKIPCYSQKAVYRYLFPRRTYQGLQQKEWVLNGATVLYGSATELRATLDYDFSEEKKFSYKNLSMDEIIHHLAFFISRLWQIHVFGEGNTGTTAVFLRNLLLNENHPLHNRILHISGTFKEPEKVNIDSGKSEH